MFTCLVTGGAGFIGSNFILYMLRDFDDVRIVNMDCLTYAGNLENLVSVEHDARYSFEQRSISNEQDVKYVFEQYRPDCVVNFAAESHVDRSITGPKVFFDTNVIGTVNLLDAARNAWDDGAGGFGDHKFLQVSTDEVYGTLSLDDPDTYFVETTPLSPHSPYSASKASADLAVSAYWDTFGLPVNITRCSNNYGPYQFPEKLIPLMINNALHHKKLPVYGDGLNIRDWLFVEDHCKAINLVLREAEPGRIYNVGGHNEHSNISIVKAIIRELSQMTGDNSISDDLIEYVADRKGHDRRYGIAADRLREDLGWEPETVFETGIVHTIAWYLENREWVENVTSGEYRAYYERMYGSDE